MDLIDKQHIVRFQIGQQRGQVARTFQHRAGRLPHIHLQFVTNNIGQRGLAQPGRAKQQHMIQRLLAIARRTDEDLHLLAHHLLAHIVGQHFRANGTVVCLFPDDGFGVNQTIGFYHACCPCGRAALYGTFGASTRP